MRRLLIGCTLAMWLSAASAHAQTPSSQDRALAESLFREAKELAKAEDYDRACPKFAESQRLDPQLGTLLHLATCHEQQGKTASAWAEYSAAAELAASKGETKREKLARSRVQALEPQLSRVEVEVVDAVVGLTVRLDDRELGEAVWGTALPIDPGRHRVEARAPGHEPWSKDFEVAADAETTAVRVPALQTRVDHGGGGEGEGVPPPDDGAPLRLAGYVLTGVGAAGLAVAGVLGLAAANRRATADEHCDGRFCDDDGLAMHDSARALATGSTATFVVGVAALGVGITLMVVGQPSHTNQQALQLSSSRQGASVSWRLTW